MSLKSWIQSNGFLIGNELIEEEDIMTRRAYSHTGKLLSESALELSLLSEDIDRKRVTMKIC